jgi:hypothetical protein
MQIRRMAIAIIGDCFPSLSSRRGRRTTHPTCSGSTTNIVRRANPGHLLHALEELDDRKAETDQRDGSPHPRHHRAFECVSRARRVRSQAKWRSPVTRTSNLPALGAVRASAISGAFLLTFPTPSAPPSSGRFTRALFASSFDRGVWGRFNCKPAHLPLPRAPQLRHTSASGRRSRPRTWSGSRLPAGSKRRDHGQRQSTTRKKVIWRPDSEPGKTCFGHFVPLSSTSVALLRSDKSVHSDILARLCVSSWTRQARALHDDSARGPVLCRSRQPDLSRQTPVPRRGRASRPARPRIPSHFQHVSAIGFRLT